MDYNCYGRTKIQLLNKEMNKKLLSLFKAFSSKLRIPKKRELGNKSEDYSSRHSLKC